MRCRTQYPVQSLPSDPALGLCGDHRELRARTFVVRCGEWTADQGKRGLDGPKDLPGSWRKANALQSSGIDVYPLLVPSMFILSNLSTISHRW